MPQLAASLTVWFADGNPGAGLIPRWVLRRAKLGPLGQPFASDDQGGALALGDRTSFITAGEYVLVGLGAAASSLRPAAELNVRLTDDWSTALIFASMPNGPVP